MQYKLILRILISFTARVGCMLILSVSLATPGSRIAALRLTVLATLSGATVEGIMDSHSLVNLKYFRTMSPTCVPSTPIVPCGALPPAAGGSVSDSHSLVNY